jgi:hypothetical protein
MITCPELDCDLKKREGGAEELFPTCVQIVPYLMNRQEVKILIGIESDGDYFELYIRTFAKLGDLVLYLFKDLVHSPANCFRNFLSFLDRFRLNPEKIGILYSLIMQLTRDERKELMA